MTIHVDRLELECQIRLIEHASKRDPSDTALDLWTDGFWAGVRAQHHLRPLARLQELIASLKASYRIPVDPGLGR